MFRKGAELHLTTTHDFSCHDGESGMDLYWQNQRMLFLTKATTNISEIGPWNAISIETCRVVELDVNF